MRVKVKCVNVPEFYLELEPSMTILGIKELIEKEHGFEVNNQKLILRGKILKNEDTVESLNLIQSEILTLFASKPRSKTTSSKPVTTKPDTVKQEEKIEQTNQEQPSEISTKPIEASSNDNSNPSNDNFYNPSQIVVGKEYQKTVENLKEMGFEEVQIKQAMAAAFNNPARATDFLLNGIPDSVLANLQSSAPEPSSVPATQQPTSGNEAASNPEPETPLPSLSTNLFNAAQQLGNQRNNEANANMLSEALGDENYAQILQAIRQNPALIEPILTQIASHNPEFLEAMRQNPALLENLLQAGGLDIQGYEDENDESFTATLPEITPEDEPALSRLQELGFPRETVIRAYLCCDKNEELAANFLFDSPGFDDN